MRNFRSDESAGAWLVVSSRGRVAAAFLIAVAAFAVPSRQAVAQPGARDTGAVIFERGTVADRPACAACHMPDGSGLPDVGIPRLAGLSASYIADQLDYFASGARENAAMSIYAKLLAPNERQAVAAYVQSLPMPPSAEVPVPPAARLVRGAQLFLDGDVRNGLIGCAQCHGPTGLGIGDFSPRLAGQSQPYIESQLEDWKSGQTRDPKGMYMHSIASHLTAADVKAVSAYIASLDGRKESKP